MRTILPTKQIPEIDHIEAGRRIRQMRERTGMSVRRLAKEMGFSAPFVSDLELGRRNWTSDNFSKAKAILTGGDKTTPLTKHEIADKIARNVNFWVLTNSERKLALDAARFAGVRVRTEASFTEMRGFDIHFLKGAK